MYRKAQLRGDALARDTTTLGYLLRVQEAGHDVDRRLWEADKASAVKFSRKEGVSTGRKQGFWGTLALAATVLLGLIAF